MSGQELEALWSLHFSPTDGDTIRAGVIVLETGKLFGGDSWYYYIGSYKGENGKLTGSFKAIHYAGPVGSPVFGDLAEATIDFEEIRQQHDSEGRRRFFLSGTVRERPGLSAVGILTWRQNLP